VGSPKFISKKLVLKLRSVSNIVIPLARTGKDKINRTVVNNKLQTNKEIRSMVIKKVWILEIVLIKLILPKIEEAPAKCKLKIAKGILPLTLLSGG